jgi:DNA-binding NarL/FixJ family response regulator
VYQSSLAAPVGAHETARTEEATRSRWLRHRFTTDEQQAMIELYRSGAPAREIGERYGIGERAIKRLLQTHGVHRTAEHGSRRLSDRFSPEELGAMVELYRSGTSAREIAEKYDINVRSFKRLLQVNGVRRSGV